MTSRGASFARSWWGRSWIGALEESAGLDAARLGRGRTYARQGAVHGLVVEPGVVTARVLGSHGRYYDTEIVVRTVAPEAWDGVARRLATRSAHAAAFAVGELDPQIVDDARAEGVELLPGPGDLRPQCSCPDWAELCKHAAAVCYLVAGELDRDPALLFLLRGISRAQLAAMVRVGRRGESGEDDMAAGFGVVGREAWAGRALEDLVQPAAAHVVAPPRQPGAPLGWEGRVPVGDPVDPRRVHELAVDATVRAWSMLVDGTPSGLGSSARGDIARRASMCGSPRDFDALAARTRLSSAALRAWVDAWRLSGDAGVSVVADPDSWLIDQDRLAAGREELVGVGIPKRSVALNYDSLGMPRGVKLVLGHDGRWYRLVARPGRRGQPDQLHLASQPSRDIVDLVDDPVA